MESMSFAAQLGETCGTFKLSICRVCLVILINRLPKRYLDWWKVSPVRLWQSLNYIVLSQEGGG